MARKFSREEILPVAAHHDSTGEVRWFILNLYNCFHHIDKEGQVSFAFAFNTHLLCRDYNTSFVSGPRQLVKPYQYKYNLGYI